MKGKKTRVLTSKKSVRCQCNAMGGNRDHVFRARLRVWVLSEGLTLKEVVVLTSIKFFFLKFVPFFCNKTALPVRKFNKLGKLT